MISRGFFNLRWSGEILSIHTTRANYIPDLSHLATKAQGKLARVKRGAEHETRTKLLGFTYPTLSTSDHEKIEK